MLLSAPLYKMPFLQGPAEQGILNPKNAGGIFLISLTQSTVLL